MFLFSLGLSILLLSLAFFVFGKRKKAPVIRDMRLEIQLVDIENKLKWLETEMAFKKKNEALKREVFAHQAHCYFRSLELLVKRYDELEQMLVMPGVKVKKKKQ